MRYEYKVVPAPAKPRKGTRAKGAEAKFADGLETVMNEYAADGWEYQRADILPSEERRGLTSTHTVYRTVLVFRRALGTPDTTAQSAELEAMEIPDMPAPAPVETSDAEHISEPERRSRFSLVGPARRNAEASAPPLAAPHVQDDMSPETDPSDERR